MKTSDTAAKFESTEFVSRHILILYQENFYLISKEFFVDF